MTFTFTLTQQAHLRAMKDVATRTIAYKVSWAVFGVLVVLSLLVAAGSGQGFANALAASGPYLIVFLIILLFGFPLAHRWTVRQMHRHNRALRDPQTFELTPEFLMMRGPLHTAQIRWDAIYKIVETRHTILFYLSKGMAHFIPKDVIPPSDLVPLRQNLSIWVAGRTELHAETAAA
jgi:YcxB-like protein